MKNLNLKISNINFGIEGDRQVNFFFKPKQYEFFKLRV